MKTKVLVILLAMTGFTKKSDAQVNYYYSHPATSNGWSFNDGQASAWATTYPMYLSPDNVPCGNFYSGDYLQLKQFAHRVLFNNATLVRSAISYFAFNDFVQDYLYIAVNHQRYARRLYKMGFYEEAITHSNHAAYIVNSLFDYTLPGGYCDDYYSPDGMRKGSSGSGSRGASPEAGTNGERKMSGANAENKKPQLPAEFEKNVSKMSIQLPDEFKGVKARPRPAEMLNKLEK